MNRGSYILSCTIIYLIGGAFLSYLANPDQFSIEGYYTYFAFRVFASILFVVLSILRSKNADGRGSLVAWLQILYFIFPYVWFGQIYLSFIQSKEARQQSIERKKRKKTAENKSVEDFPSTKESPEEETFLTKSIEAALAGDAKAQNVLGRIYAEGKEVEQDYVEAIKWFRLAAEQGHVVSQYQLGLIYEKGLGVSMHKGVAESWFRLAAEQGHKNAHFNLGNR
ncbi:MAG: tetratricopeptide repeat protein, partial [Opitutae bacterium]